MAATADAGGVKVGDTAVYDPYGHPLTGPLDTRAGSNDAGWLGAGTETGDGLGGIVQLGARLYSPLLGRFLQVDPIANASANDYDYAAGDPVNYADQSHLLGVFAGAVHHQ